MDPKRRYDDKEAREIFAVAAEPEATPDGIVSSEDGFTLAELQEIGGEAGISPERVAEAAGLVRARGVALPEERSLGVVVSVGQITPLPRRPSEAEWDVLVSEFRNLFSTPGEVRVQAGALEWSNGALRVLLERTVEGHQLRLTTVNRRFRSLGRMGMMLTASGVVLMVTVGSVFAVEGGTLREFLATILPSIIVAGGGLGFVAFSRLSLPKWIAERRQQFEWIGRRAQELLSTAPPPDA